MRVVAIAFLLCLVLWAQPARAELGLAIAADADHRLVLAQGPPGLQAELIGLGPNDAPMFGSAACETLGARHLQTARAETLSLDVIVARYNLVAVWTGNLCPSGSDVSLLPAEARAWLDELAGLRRAEDGAPFIDARRRRAEVLVFGAPGAPPDLGAAQRYIMQEAESDPVMLLYLAYLTERGLTGPADSAATLDYLRRASERGNATATALLAQASELGLLGAERDEAAAYAAYARLAEGVNPPAWFRIGRMLLFGRGTPRDACRAQDFLERAQRHAWSPIAEAQLYLDQIRQEGWCRSQRD